MSRVRRLPDQRLRNVAAEVVTATGRASPTLILRIIGRPAARIAADIGRGAQPGTRSGRTPRQKSSRTSSSAQSSRTDLWADRPVGRTTEPLEATVPPHDVLLLCAEPLGTSDGGS